MTSLPPDIHTHISGRHDAVIQLSPSDTIPEGDRLLFSIGLHPWDTTAMTRRDAEAALDTVARRATDPRIVMIGETGIDLLRGGSEPLQAMILKRHAEIAEATGKPLLLHIVKAWPQAIALRRSIRPAQPWIIHGFRGKPQLAQELLDAGFHISLGERFNPATAAIIPAGRLYTETDTSLTPIEEIRQRIDDARTDRIFTKK